MARGVGCTIASRRAGAYLGLMSLTLRVLIALISGLALGVGVSLSEIGALIEAEGEEAIVAVDDDGTERPVAIEGWDHFR